MTIGIYTKDPEIKLVERISAVKDEATAWRSLLFRFSQLQEQYKSEYQKKISLNIISDHLKDNEGSIFVCMDGDIFLLCTGVSRTALEKLIFQLRYLYSDDPLAYTIEGIENADFCSLYDLSIAYDTLYSLAKKKLVRLAKKEFEPSSHLPEERTPPPGWEGKKAKPLTPTRLTSLEKDLMNTDISQVLRRQAVCIMPPGKELRRLFEEYYINISHLQRLMMADVNFFSNRWLFKYITQILDAKTLDMLSKRPKIYFENPASLNLNTDTLVSEAFVNFDKEIKPAIKVSLVIEIHISDVLDNIETFMKCRETLQKSGYRVCLDGLTFFSFPQIDRERLGFDLVKVQWNQDVAQDLTEIEHKKLQDSINRCGTNRVILSRCDNKAAIEFGHSMGLTIFQGRYLDYLLNPSSKVVN